MSPSNNMKCPKVEGKRYVLPTVSVQWEAKKSVGSHCTDDVVGGQKTANDGENKACSVEESWQRDMDKLAAVVAEAKEFINTFDAKNKFTSIGAVKPEKRGRETLCSEFITPMDLDQRPREKRMKVEENEEVCVLSPAEWNSSLQFGPKNGPNTSEGEIETNQETQNTDKSRKPKTFHTEEVCILDDVSQGREKLPIRVVNGVDDERPPPFTYDTNIEYPYWYRLRNPAGCDCINGCSDSKPCSCVLKNGGEIPFNENGEIIRAKPRVHECGPLCKCPPSCMNRVSQNGPRYELEIFKTKSMGWGVRSRSYISSGSFICEYVGKLLRDKEAERRVGEDEYLFDICDSEDEGSEVGGFAIDGAVYSNVGRFINHSCSPNLYAQEVLYDHDDKRMPHIMFFATKNIPPMQELAYDYNYKLDRVCDVNGNIKTKACYCGSRKCTGRMY